MHLQKHLYKITAIPAEEFFPEEGEISFVAFLVFESLFSPKNPRFLVGPENAFSANPSAGMADKIITNVFLNYPKALTTHIAILIILTLIASLFCKKLDIYLKI